MPPKPHEDQAAPAQVSPTGKPERKRLFAEDPRTQGGDALTTAQGLRVDDTDHTLKAGRRGPSLLEDHHFREKITHFDHERIPERVVHARGSGAHGVFESYGNASSITKAAFLAEKGKQTPVFVRFSTVLGSRGSADTVRDTRGFATKFYTHEGNFDLVGNNMPVFFIQDAIKFPDIIHAAKPHPDREIPQAQSAHDTFWDFVSLETQATHHVLWNMSDRGIPRSFRTMEGFGIHTFRLENAAGETVLVKWHWKPIAGVHSLLWEEAQLAAGMDPDFHRRDLYDAIEAGAYPEWELGVQVMPDDGTDTFQGIDLLDPTKIVPEELVPVQRIGKMTLNANPTNFFAEVEQIAFHLGNLVPGIQVTNDPLLQGRLFSYLDTQLTRLGGPNFPQLPINRPHAPVNDMLRDGMHQTAVHTGLAPYSPNSIDGGLPTSGPAGESVFVTVPTRVEGVKERAVAASFDDHYSHARLFYVSLTPVEQAHVAEALIFELGKCYETPIRLRELDVLAKVDTELAATVAAGLGLPSPAPQELPDVAPSPAFSQVVTEPGPIQGRIVGVVVSGEGDLDGVGTLRAELEAGGAIVRVVAPVGGQIGSGKDVEIVERTLATTRSFEYDAVLVAPGAGTLRDVKLQVLLQEAYRHLKPVGAWSDGVAALRTAGVPVDGPGVLVSDEVSTAYAGQLQTALGLHRVWDRAGMV